MWVIAYPGDEPEVARWCAKHSRWNVLGCEVTIDRVHKVGVGGTLDAPPDVWEDDLPLHVYSVFDDTPAFGTDDRDAGVAR